MTFVGKIMSLLFKNTACWPPLVFLGSKITADDDWNHKIKTLAAWKESYDQPRQRIKKQRHHLQTKVFIVKAIVFAVVMYACKIWTIKKAEH